MPQETGPPKWISFKDTAHPWRARLAAWRVLTGQTLPFHLPFYIVLTLIPHIGLPVAIALAAVTFVWATVTHKQYNDVEALQEGLVYATSAKNHDEGNSQKEWQHAKVPEVPSGWTTLLHGTNLARKEWNGKISSLLDSPEIKVEGFSGLSVITQEDLERDQRAGLSGTTAGYASIKNQSGLSDQEFAARNVPTNFKILFPQNYINFPNLREQYLNLVPEDRREALLKLIDIYYSRNIQFGRHPVVPGGTRLVKLAQRFEDGVQVIYFVPAEVMDLYQQRAQETVSTGQEDKFDFEIKVYPKTSEEKTKEWTEWKDRVRSQLQQPVKRGSGWLRIVATLQEAEEFHKTWTSKADGVYSVEINGQHYQMSASVWEKMKTWSERSAEFERKGYFIYKEILGGNVITDFIPLGSIAYDPASVVGINDPDATQSNFLSFDSYGPGLTGDLAEELGLNLTAQNRLAFDQVSRNHSDLKSIPFHSHHLGSNYPNGPSRQDQRERHEAPGRPALVYAVKSGVGYFYTDQNITASAFSGQASKEFESKAEKDDLNIADIGLDAGPHHEVNAVLRDAFTEGRIDHMGMVNGVHVYKVKGVGRYLFGKQRGHAGIARNHVYIAEGSFDEAFLQHHEIEELKVWQRIALELAGIDVNVEWEKLEDGKKRELANGLRAYLARLPGPAGDAIKQLVQDEADRLASVRIAPAAHVTNEPLSLPLVLETVRHFLEHIAPIISRYESIVHPDEQQPLIIKAYRFAAVRQTEGRRLSEITKAIDDVLINGIREWRKRLPKGTAIVQSKMPHPPADFSPGKRELIQLADDMAQFWENEEVVIKDVELSDGMLLRFDHRGNPIEFDLSTGHFIEGKTRIYQGPVLSIHGWTENGRLMIGGRPANEVIDEIARVKGIKKILIAACNPFAGDLGPTSIPVIYATGIIALENGYSTFGHWRTNNGQSIESIASPSSALDLMAFLRAWQIPSTFLKDAVSPQPGNYLNSKESDHELEKSVSQEIHPLVLKRLSNRPRDFQRRFEAIRGVLASHTALSTTPNATEAIIQSKDPRLDARLSLLRDLLAYEMAIYHYMPQIGDVIEVDHRTDGETGAYMRPLGKNKVLIAVDLGRITTDTRITQALISEVSHAVDELVLSTLGYASTEADSQERSMAVDDRITEVLDMSRRVQYGDEGLHGVLKTARAQKTFGMGVMTRFFRTSEHQRAVDVAASVFRVTQKAGRDAKRQEKIFGLAMVFVNLVRTAEHLLPDYAQLIDRIPQLEMRFNAIHSAFQQIQTEEDWLKRRDLTVHQLQWVIDAIKDRLTQTLSERPLFREAGPQSDEIVRFAVRETFRQLDNAVNELGYARNIQALRENELVEWFNNQEGQTDVLDFMFHFLNPNDAVAQLIDAEFESIRTPDELLSALQFALSDMESKTFPSDPRAQAILQDLQSDFDKGVQQKLRTNAKTGKTSTSNNPLAKFIEKCI